jgi:hypothetical protein
MAAKDIGGALDLTVVSLKEGVVRLGAEAALPEISAWQERLAALHDPDLEAVAGRGESSGRSWIPPASIP